MEEKLQSLKSAVRVGAFRFKLEAGKFAHPFYVFNTLLAVSFVLLRLVRPLCSLLFKQDAEGGPCEFDMVRESVFPPFFLFEGRKKKITPC